MGEARVPFLDKEVLEMIMNIDPQEKMCSMAERPDGVHPKMEKYLLRKAFDVPEDPYLPEEVLWRQKEQFSDGVGYDWVDGLKNYAEAVISDAEFDLRHERFPRDPPQTKEYYFLRSMFEKYYPGNNAISTIPDGRSIACSTPEALAWKPEWQNQLQGDISGRAAGVNEEGRASSTTSSSSSRPLVDRNVTARSSRFTKQQQRKNRPLRAVQARAYRLPSRGHVTSHCIARVR